MKAPIENTLNLALALEGSAVPASDEIKRLTGIAEMIDTLPDPEIDPRFIARLEATLMAEFDAQQADAQVRPTLQIVKPHVAEPEPEPEERVAPNVIALPKRRFVVRKALVAAIAAAMLMALPVLASAKSLPGSPFFGIEQWRQNHAINGAEGAEKAFVTERIARKWIGYGAEMVALEYPASRIDAALQHAGFLQTRAAQLIAAYGTPEQIERFGGMLRADLGRLERIRELAPDHAKAVLDRAIVVTADLASRLAKEVHVPGPLARAGRLGTVVKPSIPATGGGSVDEGTTPAKPGDKSGTKRPLGEDQTKNLEAPVECDMVFSAQVGSEVLKQASTTICDAEKAYDEATGADE